MLYSNAQPLMPAEDYPYTAKDGECQYDASKGLIAASGATFVEVENPYMM